MTDRGGELKFGEIATFFLRLEGSLHIERCHLSWTGAVGMFEIDSRFIESDSIDLKSFWLHLVGVVNIFS